MPSPLEKAMKELGEAAEKLNAKNEELRSAKRSKESIEATIEGYRAKRKKLINRINDKKDPPSEEEKDEYRREINKLEASIKEDGPQLEAAEKRLSDAEVEQESAKQTFKEANEKFQKEIQKLIKP